MSNKASGILSTQYFIEPLTQASLSLFHFSGKQKSKQSELDEINKIFSGRSDLILLKVFKEEFCPYSLLEINFNRISVLHSRDVINDDRERTGPSAVLSGIIKSNLFTTTQKVVAITLFKEKLESSYLDLFMVWYYLKKVIRRYVYIPLPEKSEIAVIPRDNDIDSCKSFLKQQLYSYQSPGTTMSPDFNIKDYLSSDNEFMNFHIKDKVSYQTLLETSGVVDITYCDIHKACEYYGIETARDMVKERFLSLVSDSKYLRVILDFLTYKGYFTTGETDSIVRSMGGSEVKRDIMKYAMSFEESSFEDDMETRMLLGKMEGLDLSD